MAAVHSSSFFRPLSVCMHIGDCTILIGCLIGFLLAERKIRLRCLVQDGFDFSAIKDIFKDVETDAESKVTSEGNLLLEVISNYGFENVGSISEADQSTLFYTAGYIARSLLKSIKCKDCKDMLTAAEIPVTADEIPDEYMDEKPAREEYVDMVNRGGLTKPSDVLHVTCAHAWGLYVCMSDNADAFKMLLESSNPRSVFVHCFMEKIKLPRCSSLYNTTCSSGCMLHNYLRRVAAATFNFKAKNFAARKNDEIRNLKRPPKADPKKSASAKKIKKLASS